MLRASLVAQMVKNVPAMYETWVQSLRCWRRRRMERQGKEMQPCEKWTWKSHSRVQLFETPWTIQSMEFSRPAYWSGKPLPSPGDFPKPRSLTLWVDSLPAELWGKPKNTGVGSLPLLQQIFPTQISNQGLLHCSCILYQLSYHRSQTKGHIKKTWRVERKSLSKWKVVSSEEWLLTGPFWSNCERWF